MGMYAPLLLITESHIDGVVNCSVSVRPKVGELSEHVGELRLTLDQWNSLRRGDARLKAITKREAENTPADEL